MGLIDHSPATAYELQKVIFESDCKPEHDKIPLSVKLFVMRLIAQAQIGAITIIVLTGGGGPMRFGSNTGNASGPGSMGAAMMGTTSGGAAAGKRNAGCPRCWYGGCWGCCGSGCWCSPFFLPPSEGGSSSFPEGHPQRLTVQSATNFFCIRTGL